MKKQEQEIFNDISSLADEEFEKGNYKDDCPESYIEDFCFEMASINYEDRISDVMADYGNEITSLFSGYLLSKKESIGESYVKFYDRYKEVLIKCYKHVVDKIYNDQVNHRMFDAGLIHEDRLDYVRFE